MPNRFVWVEDLQTISENRQGEPPPWPREVLDRHGLRELKPSEAAPDPRRAPRRDATSRKPVRPLRSTVYRAGTLLVPDKLFKPVNDASLSEVNKVIADEHDLAPLVPPNALDRDGMDEVPRPVALFHEGGGSAPDAWEVLQSVRQAVREGRFRGRNGADAVDRITIEHAFFGAMFGPGPNGDPHGVRDDLGFSPARIGYGRRPVAYLADPPPRPESQGRRPRIAVLDTGYGSHAWFGTEPQKMEPPNGGFLHAFKATQQMIAAQSEHVAGLTLTRVLTEAAEDPLYTDEISQVLAPATGHGTFITGLIRQHAPVADVLSVRVLQPDNVAYESDVLLALYMLLTETKLARANGDPDGIVDVISLSLGYYPEDPEEAKESRIAEVLKLLAAEGVIVVACAGNDSTARPFLPASLAWECDWNGPNVTGVGALNPNGSVAWFSNTGKCCNVFAPGANVVSVFPDNVRGSAAPSATFANREGMDPDDYTSGFASWSGTSFATPLVAAEIARLLADDGQLGLNDLGVDSAVRRAERALERLRDAALPAGDE